MVLDWLPALAYAGGGTQGTCPRLWADESEQLAKNGKTIEQQQATHSSYCSMILHRDGQNSQFFAPAAPIGTAGEIFRSNSKKFQQKINQIIPFSSKIPKFRARLRCAKVFSKKVKSGNKFSLKISKK